MFKMITFTKTDMKRNFMDNQGCPIFTAMKRAGVPVHTVGASFWIDNGLNKEDLFGLHQLKTIKRSFSKKLREVSGVLAESYRYSSPTRMKTREKFIGKSFKVAYLFLFLMVMGGCGVEGVFLDKAYRICRGHNGIQSVNLDAREVACHDGLVKNFRTRARG